MKKFAIVAALFFSGCAYHRVKINVPGCGVSTVKQETSCEKPYDVRDGVEVVCHDFIMTPSGPVVIDRIVTYHCVKVYIKEN